jgi:flagellar hook-associated protein 1
MATSILGVGQSALAAAQAGLTTTGHNIANANTPGYTRQIVMQASAGSQDTGFGFVGKGTQVVEIKRVYSEYLNNQVNSSQTSANQLQTYYNQISRINNQFADPESGLAPVMQDFFKGVQELASNPASASSRQSALSSAETLAARFNSLNGQLQEMRESVGGQINSSISNINQYAKEIAKLNDAIERAQGNADGRVSNDLLDQRDLAVTELSKEIKTTVVKQGASYSVFIGNGQPLVASTKTFELVPTVSKTDPSRTAVGYISNGVIVELSENSLPGGKLGGLLEFRLKSLDIAQNSLGRIATGLAMTMNAQHMLGQDQNGALGGNLFNVASPDIRSSTANTGNAVIGATITSASALTTSDYRLQFVGGNYVVTRLSDNTVQYNNAAFPAAAIDGVTFSVTSGAMNANDEFVIKPTLNGASGFSVAFSDITKLAAAAPIRTAAPTANTGSGQISAGSVNSTFTAATVTPSVTLTYNSTTGQFSGFPATMPVTVTNGGVATVFAAGAPVTYTSGATISFGGASFTISGAPNNGDTFTVGQNSNGLGDNRNALLLASQQTANTLSNGTTSYQGAYAQLVSLVGNKTREVEVAGKAESKLLTQAITSQQAESGVNLDEEATNLLRYQQAYQAAGKVMQTASQLFELLLTLGD